MAIVGAVVALGGASAASVPGISPCGLVTVAQVRAAFGGTVGAGRIDNSLPGAPTCHFAVKGSNLGADGEAIVFITPGQTPALFALARKLVPGAVPVPGLANGAFYNVHTTAIELLKGTTVANAQAVFFTSDGTHLTTAKVKADVTALARSVAAHV